MRYSQNIVVLSGLVGRDPELKHVGQNNNAMCTFGLATTEGYKDRNGEWQNKTTWHDIKCWRKTAEEAALKIRKGDTVTVFGKLDKESWEDKDTQKKMYKASVVIDSFTVQPKGTFGNDAEGAGNQEQW